MKEKIKYVYIKFVRSLLHVFFIFPIRKNQIIFESFSGAGASCNPKYIYEFLETNCRKELRFVWALKDPSKFKFDNNTIVCKYRSLKHIFYRITSGVYVCNFLQATEIPKRKKQMEIQTWHGGGCYKRVGTQEQADEIYSKRLKISIQETDLFISSSRFFSDNVIRDSFEYKGEILECGMPRNDILINEVSLDEKNKIKKELCVESDTIVVLYAPTWKKGHNSFERIDVEKIRSAVIKKYNKKCSILFRAHIYGTIESCDDVINVTDYPDMQELLLISDILITDYSSSMWDFSLTFKPCFLYVPDLKDYVKSRGLDVDIYRWGFPVCCNNEELYKAIIDFNNEKNKEAMDKHHKDLGSFENGHASEIVCKKIISFIGSKNR